MLKMTRDAGVAFESSQMWPCCGTCKSNPFEVETFISRVQACGSAFEVEGVAHFGDILLKIPVKVCVGLASSGGLMGVVFMYEHL